MTGHCAIARNMTTASDEMTDSCITIYNFRLAFILLNSTFARVSFVWGHYLKAAKRIDLRRRNDGWYT